MSFLQEGNSNNNNNNDSTEDGEGKLEDEKELDKEATSVTFDGLIPGKEYIIDVTTLQGEVESDPVMLKAKTSKFAFPSKNAVYVCLFLLFCFCFCFVFCFCFCFFGNTVVSK